MPKVDSGFQKRNNSKIPTTENDQSLQDFWEAIGTEITTLTKIKEGIDTNSTIPP